MPLTSQASKAAQAGRNSAASAQLEGQWRALAAMRQYAVAHMRSRVDAAWASVHGYPASSPFAQYFILKAANAQRSLGWRRKASEAKQRAADDGVFVPDDGTLTAELMSSDASKWEEQTLSKAALASSPDLRLWYRREPIVQGVECVRFTGVMKGATPSEIAPLLFDPSKRTWDPNYSEFKQLEHHTEKAVHHRGGKDQPEKESYTIYARVAVPRFFKYVAPPRDFVQKYEIQHDEKHDKWLIMAKSVHRDDIPPVQGVVRAHLYGQVVEIEPAKKEDPSAGTRITVTSLNDVKIPAMAQQFQPMVLKKYPARWFRSLSTAVGDPQPSRFSLAGFAAAREGQGMEGGYVSGLFGRLPSRDVEVALMSCT